MVLFLNLLNRRFFCYLYSILFAISLCRNWPPYCRYNPYRFRSNIPTLYHKIFIGFLLDFFKKINRIFIYYNKTNHHENITIHQRN